MLIFGAGGFAKQLIPSLQRLNLIDNCVFYHDVNKEVDPFFLKNFTVIRNEKELVNYFLNVSNEFVLGIGDAKLRQEVFQNLSRIGGKPKSIIDPEANLSSFDVSLGKGLCILKGAIIEPNVKIGNGALISLNAIISHDSDVGDFSVVSPGAILLGNSRTKETSFVGAGAILLPNVTIGNFCTIGAGAVVTKDVKDGDTVLGIPVRLKS